MVVIDLSNNFNLTPEQINEMLSGLPSSVTKNSDTKITNEQVKKLNDLLNDKNAVETILKSDKAQELMKKIKGEN